MNAICTVCKRFWSGSSDKCPTCIMSNPSDSTGFTDQNKYYLDNQQYLDSDLPVEIKLRILERALEAERKQIYSKACTVGDYIAPRSFIISYDYQPSAYESDGMVPGYQNITISWSPSPDASPDFVFESSGGIPRRYVPGDWEQILDKLYQEKLIRLEQEKQQELQAQQQQLTQKIENIKNKYGLG